jgi:hypothetical protein
MVSTILLHRAQRTKFEKANLLIWFAYNDVRWIGHCPALQLQSSDDSFMAAHRQLVWQVDQFAQKCHLMGNLEPKLIDLGWIMDQEVYTFQTNSQKFATEHSAENFFEEYLHFTPTYLFDVNE